MTETRMPWRSAMAAGTAAMLCFLASGLGVASAAAAERERPAAPTEANVDNATEMRKLAQSTIGDVLLFDRKSGIAIGAKKAGDRLDMASINVTTLPMVGVELVPRDGHKRPEVRYSVTDSFEPLHMGLWVDLNGDGVFDYRLLRGQWPQFSDETGSRAFIDGKWIPAVRTDRKDQLDHPTVVANGVEYHFDFAQSKWVPATEREVTSTTRPTR